jgi:hypothetical protein
VAKKLPPQRRPPPLGHVNDTAQASAMVQFIKRLGAFWGTRGRREGGARIEKSEKREEGRESANE